MGWRWGWTGPYPGKGPWSYLPPPLRPGWVFGRGWCWYYLGPLTWWRTTPYLYYYYWYPRSWYTFYPWTTWYPWYIWYYNPYTPYYYPWTPWWYP